MRFAVVAHRSSATNDALVAAARAAGLDANRLRPRDALRTLEPGDVALARLDVTEELDGIEPGLTELERLAESGVEVLNPPAALAAAHDKLLTARALRHSGVPHPHSWLIADGLPAPAPELPLVLKPRFGSWGREVRLCRTHDELEQALTAAATQEWFREQGALAQEVVPPLGWDLRVVVAGDRVVGSAYRVAAPGEWRTNAALGASVEPGGAPPLAHRLAVAAAQALRADLAGVDLLPTRTGFVALEVNGAVDFRPLYAPGRDVFADTIAALLAAVDSRRALLAV
ncbi:MAG TPA: hypothetical protein VHD91_11140 [Gaiellaceae bacterium]|nr:hypothetical protein [Gaiellaceae bacterium]